MAEHQRPENIQREALIVEMRKAGMSYPDIAEQLGMEKGEVHKEFRRALARIPAESAEEVSELIKARLDFTTNSMLKVMRTFHPLVNNGKVMQNPETGELLDDPLPKIAAAKIVVTAAERVARLMGLDAPRTSVTVTLDGIEAEIRRLESELLATMPEGDGGARPAQSRKLMLEAGEADREQGFR